MIKDSDKEALKKFGQNLRKLRDAQKLSLRDLSNNCNVDNSKISKIEQGLINITFTTILELAKGLDVEPSELMKF